MLLHWLEQEQQRDTCWHRTKTLASSPYNYVFLRQPWTRDGIAIPASRSRSQDSRPPTTGPRMHRCLKPGHDSTTVDSITSRRGADGGPWITWGSSNFPLLSPSSSTCCSLTVDCLWPSLAGEFVCLSQGSWLLPLPLRQGFRCASLGTSGSSHPVANHSPALCLCIPHPSPDSFWAVTCQTIAPFPPQVCELPDSKVLVTALSLVLPRPRPRVGIPVTLRK